MSIDFISGTNPNCGIGFSSSLSFHITILVICVVGGTILLPMYCFVRYTLKHFPGLDSLLPFQLPFLNTFLATKVPRVFSRLLACEDILDSCSCKGFTHSRIQKANWSAVSLLIHNSIISGTGSKFILVSSEWNLVTKQAPPPLSLTPSRNSNNLKR